MPPALQKRPNHKKLLTLLFKIFLTVAAFWFALRDVDWVQLSDVLKHQQSSGFGLAAVMVFFQIVLGALRWKFILASLSDLGKKVISAFEAFRLYYISVFFSCCLPGTIGGDLIRVWIARSDKIPLSLSVTSIIIDRLIALAGLGVIVIIMSPFLAQVLGFDLHGAAMIFAVLSLLGVAFLLNIERVLGPFRHIKIIHLFLYFINCLRLMIRKPLTSLNSLVFAALAHICFCICAYILAQSMQIQLSLMHCVMFMPLVMLAITMPISVGGWGVREMSMVGLLGLVGVPDAQALAISVQLGLLNILVSLPGSLFWLTLKNRKSIRKGNISLGEPVQP